jgi:hypothetical protein
MRPSGTPAATISSPPSASSTKAIIFEGKGPGAMAFTVIRSAARRCASWRVTMWTAALLAA